MCGGDSAKFSASLQNNKKFRSNLSIDMSFQYSHTFVARDSAGLLYLLKQVGLYYYCTLTKVLLSTFLMHLMHPAATVQDFANLRTKNRNLLTRSPARQNKNVHTSWLLRRLKHFDVFNHTLFDIMWHHICHLSEWRTTHHSMM